MSHVVFATARYHYLAEALCRRPGFAAGELTRQHFPDGERLLRFGGTLQGHDAVLIGGTIDDSATLELFDMASGLTSLGINKLSLVIPYFGYSTQERAIRQGEVVTAKSRAVLLSALPRSRLWNEVLLVDLHTPGIAHYFEGHQHSVHLSALSLALNVVKRIAQTEPTVVGCTDAGRAKWVQALANAAMLPAAFVYKARQDDGKIAVTGVNADVRHKHVVIYDDMVRSGSTLMEAARAYRSLGAIRITAVATHGVLPGNSLEALASSGLFTALYCTDTHPRAQELAANSKGFLRLSSIAGVISDYLSGEPVHHSQEDA